jgi:hypothetical protein
MGGRIAYYHTLNKDCITIHAMKGPQDRIPPPDVPNRIISLQGKFTAIQFDLPNYLRIIMFGCWGQESYKNFQPLAVEVSPYKMQTDEKSQYLKSSNLFDNELLVVQINDTVIAMADTYAEFCFNLTQHKDSPFPKAVPDEKYFYRSIALFRLTVNLLKKAATAGIDPKLNVDPRFIDFDPEDVDR